MFCRPKKLNASPSITPVELITRLINEAKPGDENTIANFTITQIQMKYGSDVAVAKG